MTTIMSLSPHTCALSLADIGLPYFSISMFDIACCCADEASSRTFSVIFAREPP